MSARCNCGTGFSREEACVNTLAFAVCPLTPSRLKPVPHGYAIYCGTGFSREEACVNTLAFAVYPLTPSRLKPVPL